jgi:hypothetical protein
MPNWGIFSCEEARSGNLEYFKIKVYFPAIQIEPRTNKMEPQLSQQLNK